MNKIEVLGQSVEPSEWELFNEICKFKRYSSGADASKISAYLTRPEAILQTAANKKGLRNSKRIYLENAVDANNESLLECLKKRRSCRDFSSKALSLEELSAILSGGVGLNGISNPVGYPDLDIFMRPYPSGGGLYPIEVYAIGLNIKGKEPFIAHYSCSENSLSMLDESASRKSIESAFMLSTEQLRNVPLIVVFSGVFQRTTIKYGDRGFKLALLEAGHACQNILLMCESISLGASAWSSYYDNEVDNLIGINGVDESIMHAVIIGRKSN